MWTRGKWEQAESNTNQQVWINAWNCSSFSIGIDAMHPIFTIFRCATAIFKYQEWIIWNDERANQTKYVIFSWLRCYAQHRRVSNINTFVCMKSNGLVLLLRTPFRCDIMIVSIAPGKRRKQRQRRRKEWRRVSPNKILCHLFSPTKAIASRVRPLSIRNIITNLCRSKQQHKVQYGEKIAHCNRLLSNCDGLSHIFNSKVERA